jgi:AraC-like DNA-binding protein
MAAPDFTNARLDWDPDAYQRASVLGGVPGLLAQFDVSAEIVLEGMPLDSTIFSKPDLFLPYSWVVRILANCATATRCPHFGLLLGTRTDYRALGPPGQWIANAPDLQTAITGFEALQSLNSRGATVYLRRAGSDFILGYGAYDHTAAPHEQAYAMSVGMSASVIKSVTGGVARPSEVLFSFRRPKNVAPYLSFFDAPVRFDQYETGLILSERALKAPIIGSKIANFAFWRAKALELAPHSVTPWSDSVRHALRPLLLDRRISARAAASLLAVDVRTLSRRLAGEGAHFQTILDGVRYTVARELLAVTDLRVGDIAMALAYATHGAFVVAFRRWAGVSPIEWRERLCERRRVAASATVS